MVKLEAIRKNGIIMITEHSFNYLLSCLDNQKFVGEAPINGDSVSVGKEKYDKVQNEIQDAIDSFNRQCRELLNSDETPVEPSCGGCQGCG